MIFYRQRSEWFIFLFLTMLLALVSACGNASLASNTNGGAHMVQVVAAENFYGDVARQLGGEHVSVTSILSDPNIDPHTFQSNVQTGITVSRANLVIENGGGYDSWMDTILSSVPDGNRLLLKGFDLIDSHHRLPENEHVWYSFDTIVTIAQAITADLKKMDPHDTTTFENNLQVFKQSVQPLQQKLATLKEKYNGTPVGLTETMYLYQTGPAGLRVLTPFEFEKAVAEANDPPAEAVIAATNQIDQHQIKVLIYNEQTVTPITTNLKDRALARHIPLVPITETMPAGKTYQTWMMGQLNTLQTALGG